MPIINTKYSYDLPENFDIQKKKGDDTVSKEEAIDMRVSELFKLNKAKYITLAILTLPLFPIAWAIGYALIRKQAKEEVIGAIAIKRIGLLTSGEKSDKIIDRFYKKSQKGLFANYKIQFNSSFPFIDGSPKDQWDNFKKSAIRY